MSMDRICMLLGYGIRSWGICCMDMVYALGRWDMLYGHGRCLVVGEEYMCCIYSTCFVDEIYFQRRFLRKNDFEKMTLFFENIRFLTKNTFFIKNITFELLDHHHELNQKKLILKEFFMFKIDSPMLKL